MKKIFSLLLVAALLPLSFTPAKAQIQDEGFFNHLSIGAGVGLADGISVTLSTNATRWLHLRAGYSLMPYATVYKTAAQIPAWGSFPAANTEFGARMGQQNGHLLLDFVPFRKSSFRVTVGFFAGENTLLTVSNSVALPAEYTNLGIAYYPKGDNTDMTDLKRIKAVDGILSAQLKRKNVFMPYAGIGFGSPIPSKRVGVVFDLGVAYSGGMGLFVDAVNIEESKENVRLTSAGMQALLNDINGTTGNNEMNTLKYIDMIYNEIPLTPFIRLSVVVKIF